MEAWSGQHNKLPQITAHECALKAPKAIQNPPIRVNMSHVASDTASIPCELTRRNCTQTDAVPAATAAHDVRTIRE